MLNELEVLTVVVRTLESAGIHYMVTGSIAANFYTTPRMTRDIDIIIEVEDNGVRELVSLFSNEFIVDLDLIEEALRRRSMFNIIHKEAIVKVDMIIRKDTEYRRLEFQRRRVLEFEGREIFVVSPEDLILSKLSWAKDSMSEIQINDVRNLVRTVSGLDRNYLAWWVGKLELAEIYQKVE